MIQNLLQNVFPVEKSARFTALSITGDTTWDNVVAANYILQYVVIENTTANEAILDMGTTDGGNDVFTGQTIAANDLTTIVVNKVFSLSAATSLDLNDDQIGSDWNSASVNVAFILTRVT